MRKRTHEPPQFLSVAEVARLLRVSTKTIYLAIGRDELAGVLRIGGSIRIERGALLASLKR